MHESKNYLKVTVVDKITTSVAAILAINATAMSTKTATTTSANPKECNTKWTLDRVTLRRAY